MTPCNKKSFLRHKSNLRSEISTENFNIIGESPQFYKVQKKKSLPMQNRDKILSKDN